MREDDKYSKEVYIVVNEGEVVYVSLDQEDAEGYAYNRTMRDRDSALKEMGRGDDPSETELAEAAFMAGYNGGIYEVHYIDLSSYNEDDDICVGSDEISYNDIISLLSANEDEEEC